MKKYLLSISAILLIALLSFSLSIATPLNDESISTTDTVSSEVTMQSSYELSNNGLFDNTPANDFQSSYELLNGNSIVMMPEHDEIYTNVLSLEKRLNSQDIAVSNADGSTSNYKTSDGDYRVDFDNMYKIYGVNPEWLSVFERGEQLDFQNFIVSDTYIWEVPIYDKNSILVSSAGFRKGMTYDRYLEVKSNLPIEGEEQEKEIDQFVKDHENKWYWVRTGNMIACEDIAFLTNTSELSKYVDSFGFMNIEDIRYVSIDTYLIDFLYIRADGEEYAIPFSLRPEYVENGVNNRVLCEMDKLLEITAGIIAGTQIDNK